MNFNFKKANWNKFSQNLIQIHLNNNEYELEINELYSKFQKIIMNAASTSIPQLNNNKNPKHKGNPWWNDHCDIARKNKWSVYKNYLKNPNSTNLILAKQSKNLCNRTIKQAKQSYWDNYCNDISDSNQNINSIWKKIKTINQKNLQPNYPIKLNANLLPTDFEKAEAFADNFALHSTLAGLTKENRDHRTKNEKNAQFKNTTNTNITSNHISSPISFDELLNHINSLNAKKTSVGPDNISNSMIKHFSYPILILLQLIFNKCWKEGLLPTIWKHSIAIPIHKPGKDNSNINNYRPIALTSNVCKLFEKIILSRLSYFCSKNNIDPRNQAGFSKGRSTLEHLVKLTTQVKQQCSRRKNTLATFFDIKKAFDQVWHYKLLSKLKA